MDMQSIKYIDKYIGIFLCKTFGFFSKSQKIEIYSPKKILLIKFSGFGNIVLALPTIRAIKKKFPNSKITFLTHTINKSVIESEPSIENILTMDIEGGFKTIKNIFKLLKFLKKNHFEMVIDFEQFSRFSALVSFFSGAKKRIGFNTYNQGREKLYNFRVKYSDNKHTSKIFGELALKIGATPNFSKTKIALGKTEKRKINNLLKFKKIRKKDIIIGIHPGCGINTPRRKWEKEKFAELADFLIETYNVKIFFTGSLKEKILIKKIQKLMKNKSQDLSGKINLRELAELISRCKIFISNDTGPLHVASAMKIPVISFFGPNTPILYGPLGKNNLVLYKKMSCSPCTTNFNEKTSKCKHFNCIKNITVHEVKEKIINSNLIK